MLRWRPSAADDGQVWSIRGAQFPIGMVGGGDSKLSPVDLGAVGVPDDMTETAQSVERRHGFIGDGGGSNPGYRDVHAPEKGRVIAGAGLDMVLAGIRDDLEQSFRRAVKVVKLEGQALATRGTGHALPLVDGGDLEELCPDLRRECYIPVRFHLSPVRRIESAK